MGKCARHPERESEYQCLKHQVYLCDDCLAFRDPELYCRFREGCIRYFIKACSHTKPRSHEDTKTRRKADL